ncbi:uncharacterized protein LOC130711315 [Lotus japonicus]|uniref:uncharacterized protein LOC130711315 n=1 Tax=Lotus japonicus TaxID=34305 RepID=UPI002582C75E|nr:uncharacterized protein LOC130711315 [Lotus japonicus]
MEDSEKLTPLKKAYAEIILNTTKEAAARIMVAERKATRFQHELASSKDQALQMMLGLKQMLDSKVKESELTSLNQQKKIEELEAQLGEAEEIVRDLRADLRETQVVLENVTKYRMNPPVEQNIKGEVAAQENLLQEKRFDPYDGSVHSASSLQFESHSISDTRFPAVNGTIDSNELCMSHDHTKNCYIHNTDFASIVIRRKEPELYRNGCTQRIRAFERSPFYGNESVSGNLDNVQDQTLVRAHEEGKVMIVATNVKADVICEKEKSDELKVVKADADIVKVHDRRKKRGLKTMKVHRSRLHSDQVKETSKESYMSSAKDSPHVLDNNDLSSGNSSMEYESEAQKDLMSPNSKVPTDTTATIEQSGPHSCAEKGEELLEGFSARNQIKDDKEPLDKSYLTRQDSLSTKSLEVPACKDVEVANVSPEQMDPKLSDLVLVGRKKRTLKLMKAYQSRLHSDQVKETNKESYLSSAKDSPHALDNNDPSRGNSSMEYENEAQKDLMSPTAKVPTDATASIEQSGPHSSTEKGEEFLKSYSDRNKIIDDKEQLDKSDLTRQDSLSTESLQVPACKDVEAANVSPEKMDPKVSDSEEKVSSRSVKDKFLKYTFHRKRKKESVSSDGVDCSPDNSSSKKRCGEKQNVHAEPQESCTKTESSRESRRLAQVARQLISLSEKKWWQ